MKIKIGIQCEKFEELLNYLKEIKNVEIFLNNEEYLDIVLSDKIKSYPSKEVWYVGNQIVDNPIFSETLFIPTSIEVLKNKLNLYKNRNKNIPINNRIIYLITQDIYRNLQVLNDLRSSIQILGTLNHLMLKLEEITLIMELNNHFLHIFSLEKVNDINLVNRLFFLLNIPYIQLNNYRNLFLYLIPLVRMQNKVNNISVVNINNKIEIKNFIINQDHLCFEILKELNFKDNIINE